MKKNISLLLFIWALAIQVSGQIIIKGVVTDAENNVPLIGATVLEKGTTNGIITDSDGNYSFTSKSETPVIVVSYIGFQSQEIEFLGQSELNFSLKADMEGIDEVVVVGYGTLKKSHVSGSVAKIKNENLEKIPVARVDKALQGQLAGVSVRNTDAQAGAAPSIVIRGISSINTSNSPLIVVDGYPVPGDLSSVDMSNIATIEVLKDAASAAIYGSRASNGVILITSKQGQSGKTSFSFNSTTGVTRPIKYDHIYPTTQEWADFVYADAAERGLTVPAQIPTMIEMGTYTDWEDEALRDNASFHNYSFNASGGNDKYNFYIGGGYTNEEGIVETNNYEKFNFKTNLSAKLTNKLEVGADVNASYQIQRVAAIQFHDIIRTQAWCPLYHTEQTVALAAVAGFDVEVGDYAHERQFAKVNGVNMTVSTGQSGIAYLKGQDRTYRTFSFMANTFANLKITDHLTFKTTLGGYFSNLNNSYYLASYAKNNGDTRGSFGDDQSLNWLNENTLNYTESFGKHDFGAMLGLSEQVNSRHLGYMEVSNFLTDEIHTLNAGTNINSAYTTTSKNTLVSTFFRLNYSYDDKYILSISSRWDGSSRFGSDNKWGYFPAASAAWRVSKEKFMSGIKPISELKVRASYGSTGNNNIGDYTSQAVVEPGANAVFGQTYQGFYQSTIANPSLSWEKTNEMDLGFDLGIKEGRIVMAFDFYNIKTNQLLLNQEVPSVTGFTNSWTNMGVVKNQGLEFEITSRNIVKGPFTWSTTANCYTNKNTLVDFAGVEELISTPDSKRPSQYIAKVGEPLVQFYGYQVDYSMGEGGEVSRSQLSQPYYPIAVESGFAYVKDQNGDKIIDDNDRVVLGNPYPAFNWAITNNFAYKNFDLSFLFEGSHGGKIYNIDSYYYGTQWKGGYVKGVDNESFLRDKVVTDWNVQDASYVALRNLMLGYTFPKELTNRWGITNLRFYFSAYNLLYFMADGYKGLNPEGVNVFDETLTWGYQRGAIPVQKNYTFGLNLTF